MPTKSFQIPPLKSLATMAFNSARSLHFLSQLKFIEKASELFGVPLKNSVKSKILIQKLQKSLWDLLWKDAEEAQKQDWPIEIYAPLDPLEYWKNFSLVYKDIRQVHKRRLERKTKEFSADLDQKPESLPSYYARNFHFQTDGYLSSESARTYDHEVEILFGGAAAPMRRQILAPLQESLKNSHQASLKLLDLACGTGSSTQYLSGVFKKSEIVGVDLSEAYLERARQLFKKHPNTSFLQANAEKLPFEDDYFDGVSCVFLFHELPFDARINVLKEVFRTLKPGALFVVVDSLQKDDIPDFNVFLEDFPINYHEPFYKNYTESPLELNFSQAGFIKVESKVSFLSKLVFGSKPIL